LKDLEASLAFVLFMLSDHLLHLKSGLKEIAANLHTSVSMLKIMRSECERLVRSGNAIVISVGIVDWRFVRRGSSDFRWLDDWMGTDSWKEVWMK
jgi:hypothetical protein